MRTFIGFALLGLAVFLLLFEVIALVDPVGTKMADDSDPFGPASRWYVHVAWFAAIAVLGAFGARFLRRTTSRQDAERDVADR